MASRLQQVAVGMKRTASAEVARITPTVGPLQASVRLTDAALSSELTPAERSILALVLGGESNAAIARLRGSAPSTVANQVASIFRKLGVSSRGELAAGRLPEDLPARVVERAGPIHVLSEREALVAAYAAMGHANKFIAYELGISEASVSTAMRSAASKLGVRSRVELVRMLACGRQP